MALLLSLGFFPFTNFVCLLLFLLLFGDPLDVRLECLGYFFFPVVSLHCCKLSSWNYFCHISWISDLFFFLICLQVFYFLISSLISSLIYWLFSSILFILPVFVFFFSFLFFPIFFFLQFISTLTVLWLEKMIDMISIFLNLSKFCVLACDLSWRMFHIHL